MRFGGHETFAVREGWLHKGLTLLCDGTGELESDTAQDRLGVGRNMVKSIRHWLLATGLAERGRKSHLSLAPQLVPSPLGKLIAERDPYFLDSATWWFLHVNLVSRREHAYTWWWFFNYFNRDRFERSVCNEGLRRYLQLHESRSPGLRTQQRDVACFLSTYARHYPPLRTDPEDGAECPFIELGLLDHFRDSGTFRLNETSATTLPPEVFCFALSTKLDAVHEPNSFIQTSIREAATQECSPGRVLRLTSEGVYEAALQASVELDKKHLEVLTLAGERVLKIRSFEPLHWAKCLYVRHANDELRAA